MGKAVVLAEEEMKALEGWAEMLLGPKSKFLPTLKQRNEKVKQLSNNVKIVNDALKTTAKQIDDDKDKQKNNASVLTTVIAAQASMIKFINVKNSEYAGAVKHADTLKKRLEK